MKYLGTGAVALLLAAGVLIPGTAQAVESKFTFGSWEAYTIDRCFKQTCAVDYTTFPAWASNPIYGEPSVEVYESPYYEEQYDGYDYPYEE
ncbi:MAG: hypothetical protein ACT4OG_04365 [Alphaproteobacteria bacterium]